MQLLDLENGSFLPGRNYGETVKFTKNDSQQLYEKNLKKQPHDWIYRTKEIEYSFNSRGYRTSEFSNINWSESIVLFGCSYVFGEGLSEPDTISSQLQVLTGKPVINFGARGASIDFCYFNSLILSNHYPTPLAVVFLWPQLSRTTMFYDSNWTGTVGPWNLKENRYLEYWFNNTHMQQIQGKLHQMSAQQIWKPKTKFYEASFFDITVDTLGCNKLSILDYSRDLEHPGVKTAAEAAASIYANIEWN